MIRETEVDRDSVSAAANDETAEARARVGAVVLRIARLIGRQMAREAFEAASPANDNEAQTGSGPE